MSTKHKIFFFLLSVVTILVSYFLYSSRIIKPLSFVVSSLSDVRIPYSKKLQYEAWSEEQEVLKTNVKSICKKYGKSVRLRVPMTEFLYSGENNLLFCKNAKVSFKVKLLYLNFFKGWNNIFAEELFVHLLKASTSSQNLEDKQTTPWCSSKAVQTSNSKKWSGTSVRIPKSACKFNYSEFFNLPGIFSSLL